MLLTYSIYIILLSIIFILGMVLSPLIKDRLKTSKREQSSGASKHENDYVHVIAMPETQFIINVVMHEDEVDTSKFGDIIINSTQYIRQSKNGNTESGIKYFKHKIDFSKYYIPDYKINTKQTLKT